MRKTVIALATAMMVITMANASVSIMNPEPRSYAEFIGADPHPNWIKQDISPMALIERTLPNTAVVTQINANGGNPGPCSPYFGETSYTITTASVVPTSDIITIGFSAQGTIPEGLGFAGLSIVCSVVQGGVTKSCSGAANEPILMQRIKQSQTAPITAWRSSNVAMSGYHGYSDVAPGVEATVTIAARTFSQPAGVKSQVCAGNMQIGF